jgi:hypothetical protein
MQYADRGAEPTGAISPPRRQGRQENPFLLNLRSSVQSVADFS